MRTLTQFTWVFLASSALFLAGCGGGGLPAGDTGTVSGKVTYNGTAVPAGCTVIFLPSGNAAGVMATGQTDATGAYKLSMKDGDQILAGKYTVGVSAPPATGPTLTDDEIMKLEKPPEAPKPPFPAKYLNAETSGIILEVKAGENTLDVTLAD